MGKHDIKWEMMYQHAKVFYEKNGHLLIPRRYQIDKDDNELLEGTKEYDSDQAIRLGYWLQKQRQTYHETMKGKMTLERLKKLNEIHMIWDISKDTYLYYNYWSQMFEYAKKFYEKNGHLMIPRDYRVDINGNELLKDTPEYNSKSAIKLGRWLYTQRVNYNPETANEVLKICYRKLDTIGMVWDNKDNHHWDRMFLYAKRFYEEHGHLMIPRYYCIDKDGNELLKDTPEYNSKSAIKLGSWIRSQQYQYKKGDMDEDKINKLESICMIWDRVNHKKDIIKLCERYGINLKKNSSLMTKTVLEISSKAEYLIDHNIALVDDNGNVNPIFFMSDVNIQVIYNVSLIDIINNYIAKNKVKRI